MTKKGKKEIKLNRHGLPVLKNGVLSMSHLQLAITVPPKARCPDAQNLFDARLTWSKVFTFFSFVKFGHVIPIEKARDESKRMIILHSAAPFCLSDEDYDMILGTDENELVGYLTGMAKNTQQALSYQLRGMMGNYVSEQVLTCRGIQPSGEVTIHLGLTGANFDKSFMDL